MRGLRGQLMATLGALVALSGMVCATEARAQRDEIAAVNVFIRAMGGEPGLMYAGAFGLATFGLLILFVGNYFFGLSRHFGGAARA